MFEPVLMTLAAVGGVLTTVYWACAVVGVGLMLASVLGGHHADGDVDVDFHVDVDVDAEAGMDADVGVDAHPDGIAAEASSLATWFSIRFLVFFVAVFGLLGVVLTHMTQVGPLGTFGVAVLGGLVAGQGVHQLFRALRRSSGNTAPSLADYVNKTARVTIAIKPPDRGEIALNVRGGQRYVPATSRRPDTSFNVGDEVAVVDYRGNAAEVVSRKEFDFLNTTAK